MRERSRFQAELVALGLRSAPSRPAPSLVPPQAFEFDEIATERETPAPDRYRVRGGLYSAREKARIVADPRGLLLTVPAVFGREERRLALKGPSPLRISKEMARFEGNKLGDYVQTFNEFSILLDEVLRHVGRLRDLLSAGGPEMPTDMTATQKTALRPTDDTQPSNAKKKAYTQWRAVQRLYADTDRQGNLASGALHEALLAGRAFDLARMGWWEAAGQMKRSIAEARRLNKPTFDMDIKLADVVSVLQGEWGLLTAVDYVLEARSKRREYDQKMKAFADIVRNADSALKDNFESMKNAGTVYWQKHAAYRTALDGVEKARNESRRLAAELGEELAPPSEKRRPVLSAIRMPPLIADAWRVLAIAGPLARRRLATILGSASLLDRATFHFAKPDPLGLGDITAIRRSLAQAKSWQEVIGKEEVEEWVAIDRQWNDTFTRFYV